MSSSAASPTASPRLPSPPPIAEDQLGPKSPSLHGNQEYDSAAQGSIDGSAARRIRVGTKAEDMADGPPLVELQDIDSAFQLTEHLKALHYSHTHPTGTNTINPITSDLARQLVTPPANTTKEIWLYELGRFLTQKTNSIIVALFADDPSCSPQTCPEMRASEWQYLCAVHDPPKSCSAIDYCCHTLDWAASTLTSSKMFPSRLGLGSSASGGSDKVLLQQMKELTNIFRRLYRIYAHAWFQHREMFWRVEGKTGLYVFFKTVCDEYGLIQPENYTIPPEAEGVEPDVSKEMESLPPPSLPASHVLQRKAEPDERDAGRVDTTKRHPRHTYNASTSSVNTSVIQEEAEEEESQLAEKPALGRQTTIMHAPLDTEDQDTSGATHEINEHKDETNHVGAGEDESAEVTVVAVDEDVPSSHTAEKLELTDGVVVADTASETKSTLSNAG